MVINRELYERNDHVKFISYTGRFPNLCRGVLTLEIDGKRYTFGYPFGEPRPESKSSWRISVRNRRRGRGRVNSRLEFRAILDENLPCGIGVKITRRSGGMEV